MAEEEAMTARNEIERTGSDEHEDYCPICFCPPSNELPFAKANCQHEYCLSCVERILLTKQRPNFSLRVEEIPDVHLVAPSKGRCAICRNEMSLFEFKDTVGNDIYKKNTDVVNSPLGGLTFMERNSSHHQPLNIPCVYQFPNNESNVKLPSTTVTVGLESHVKRFDHGCHFHEKSNTFHGQLTWSLNGDEAFPESAWAESTEVIFQFSANFSYIALGTLVHQPRQDSGKLHPLDGRWFVIWIDDGTTGYIEVRGSMFRYGPFTYRIDISIPSQPKFSWPSELNSVVQTAVSGVDLTTKPEGPTIGQSITWNTNDKDQATIVWTRESVGLSPNPQVDLLGPGGRMFRRCNKLDKVQSIPAYHGTTLFGNTFCQGLKVGLASYHFFRDGSTYISYEHPDCGHWAPLDDGTPVPSRVQFREHSFDAHNRIFRGKIKWQEEFGTSWQGCIEWIYEMHFDMEFTCILSGQVHSRLAHDGDNPREMSTFGLDMIYINAAIKEHFDAIAEADDDDADNGNVGPASQERENALMVRYTRVKNTLRQRLQREQASVRTIAIISLVLTALHDPEGSNPIDFFLYT